ncbi:hypothetical protein SVAN01_01014 [Stagonosporopsis vannaccii]|nr:hypothetical protein SVAN01_01014 [Stagonosporopsis vannaccii]
MARTHSSYTASPTRMRSPRRSPAVRSSSEDGSQYEMDLDALGLNSTFESTALEGSYEPPVDRVDTSEVEGPDDFTMNMTYWMTADVLPAHVKTRKAAQRSGSQQEARGEREAAEQDSHAAVDASTAASPTVRVHGTTASREYSTPASERSMENEEKVRSFLSALPDTELDHVPASSPLHGPRKATLQIPRPSPPKARSLQATVEDGDTPRKPTQQTVLHHPSPMARGEQETADGRIAQLQSRLDQQALASRTRITELETILSYTKSELEAARNDNYKHKDLVARLERAVEEQRAKQDGAAGTAESRLKNLETAHAASLQQLEKRLHENHAQTQQAQREDFERQLRDLRSSEQEARAEATTKSQEMQDMRRTVNELKQSSEPQCQSTKELTGRQHLQTEQEHIAEKAELQNRLTLLQQRADSLQQDLERATAELKAARDESQAREAIHAASTLAKDQHLSRITYLEANLQDTRFSLECAQADIAAKAQLFRTNLDLNANIRALRSELEIQRAAVAALRTGSSSPKTDEQLQSQLAAKDAVIAQHVMERDELSRQLNTAHGRISSLELGLTTLRVQLADAHRENGIARTDTERLSRDLQDANERLRDVRTEAEQRVAEVEKKLASTKDLKSEVDSKLRELKSQHEDLVEGHAAMLEHVRDKAEDAVRKTGALLTQERKEKTRLKKDVERLQTEIDDLRAEHEQTAALASDSDDTTTPMPLPTTANNSKDKEIAALHDIIKSQLASLKSLKSTHASTISSLKTSHDSVLASLRTEISCLQTRLDTQAADHAAINAAMDEQLAHLLSKLMKERARNVVVKRDGQWEAVQRSAAGEKELLGKVLMRQWGREECGVVEETGRGQLYEYKYAKKER